MKKLTKKQIKEILDLNLNANKKEIEAFKRSLSTIKNYLELVDKFKNCYFWNSLSSAANRRRAEEANRLQTTIKFFDREVELDFTTTYSCNNVYAHKNLTVNDIKKILKEAQNKLYVLTTDKYKNLIEEIDSIVETSKSVNHNEILFDKDYIKEFKVLTNAKSKKTVSISKAEKERLEFLRAKRVA